LRKDKSLEAGHFLSCVFQNPFKFQHECIEKRSRLLARILRVHQAYRLLVYPVWRDMDLSPTSQATAKSAHFNRAARFDAVALRRGALVRLFHVFLRRAFVGLNLRLRDGALTVCNPALRRQALSRRNFLLLGHNPRVYHRFQLSLLHSLSLAFPAVASTRKQIVCDSELERTEAFMLLNVASQKQRL